MKKKSRREVNMNDVVEFEVQKIAVVRDALMN